jgi:Flp pilus assembly pilin Flp
MYFGSLTPPVVREERVRQRGATVAEYALLVGLVAVAVLAAVTHLGRAASDRVSETATRVGDDDAGGGSTTPPPSGGSSSSTTSTSSTTTSSTSTSTTSTTTTTPSADGPIEGGFSEPVVDSNGYYWNAESELTLVDVDGEPLASVDATVQIWRHQRWFGTYYWVKDTVEVTTGPDGTVTIATDSLPLSGSYPVNEVRFDLYEVDHPDWDGSTESVSASPSD